MFLSNANAARRRRVRLAYPRALVDLILALIPACGVAPVAKIADVPESVVYRWRAVRGAAPQEPIGQLLARCDALPERYRKLLALVRQHQSQSLVEPSRAIRSQPVTVDSAAPDVRLRRDLRPEVKQRLYKARKLIDERYNENLNCAMLADAAGISRTYFIHLFGQAFGMSPYRYLMSVRLSMARRWLETSTESIDVIAAGVGFRSGANLGRAFKRSEGCNVSQTYAFTALCAASQDFA
jgi:AraC-like DNA-binding protein